MKVEAGIQVTPGRELGHYLQSTLLAFHLSVPVPRNVFSLCFGTSVKSAEAGIVLVVGAGTFLQRRHLAKNPGVAHTFAEVLQL